MDSDTTLSRLLRILDSFTNQTPSLSVKQLANRTGIPLASVYRWVDQLVEARLLRRTEDGRLGAGIKLWELGSRVAPATSLRAAAWPFLNDIQAVLKQHTQLAVLDDHGVLILERLSARGAVINQATVAGRLPLFTTSLGLVLLSAAPEHVANKLIDRYKHLLGEELELEGTNIPQGSVRGIINPTLAELRRQIADIRQKGYATVTGHLDEGTTGIAVPVHFPTSIAPTANVGALGVVVPDNSGLAPGIAPLLQASARAIMRNLESLPPVTSHK